MIRSLTSTGAPSSSSRCRAKSAPSTSGLIVSDARATMTPTSARAAYSDVVVKSTARKRSAGGSRIQETW